MTLLTRVLVIWGWVVVAGIGVWLAAELGAFGQLVVNVNVVRMGPLPDGLDCAGAWLVTQDLTTRVQTRSSTRAAWRP